jgi:hypothetical protein
MMFGELLGCSIGFQRSIGCKDNKPNGRAKGKGTTNAEDNSVTNFVAVLVA